MNKLIKLSIVSLLYLGACDTKTTNVSPSSSPNASGSPASNSSVDPLKVKAIINQRCTTCHAVNASDPSFGSPANNLPLETLEQMKENAARIKDQTVVKKLMPYAGNKTGITDDERAMIGAWVDAGAPIS